MARRDSRGYLWLVSAIMLALGCGGTSQGLNGNDGASDAQPSDGGASPGAGSLELHTMPLGARAYATATAFFQGNDSGRLIVVATADADAPVKLLDFDPNAAKWSTLFEVTAGGALPKGPHRIDAVTSFIDGGYAPSLVFGARTEVGLVNEGLFVARWGAGHYDVTKIPGTDTPGLTFVSLVDVQGGIVASCVSSSAVSPKIAAMFLANKAGVFTLAATLPGELAVDVGPGPIGGGPVVVGLRTENVGLANALVAPMRDAGGGTVVVVTPLAATGFEPATGFEKGVALPVPAGVTLSREIASGENPSVVLFAGSDGLLYHLELDGPIAQATLAAGPEHLRPGSSMAVTEIGGPGADLIQGSVDGSAGLDLMYGRDLPFQLFGSARSGKTFIPTGPAILPMNLSYAYGSNPHLFAIAKGASGAFDTALMVVVNTPTPENPAVVLMNQQAAPDGGAVPIEAPVTSDVCFDRTGTYPRATYVCALPEPCPIVAGVDATIGLPAPISIDAAAARCALERIRDDVPAHLTLSMSNLQGAAVEEIWVQGDGSAVVWRHTTLDIASWDFQPRRFPRKDKAFFDVCLAETSAKALYHCLYTWWIDDGCYAAGSLPCAKP